MEEAVGDIVTRDGPGRSFIQGVNGSLWRWLEGTCPEGPVREGGSRGERSAPRADAVARWLRADVQNQCACMARRNCSVIGYPDAEPMTESMPQRGHRAVTGASSVPSIQSQTSLG